MGYVIYDKETTKLLTRKEYITRSAARAARTRYLNKEFKRTGCPLGPEYDIAESDVFYSVIEKRVPVENLMSGKVVYEGVNTQSFMSVGSEAYWSA